MLLERAPSSYGTNEVGSPSSAGDTLRESKRTKIEGSPALAETREAFLARKTADSERLREQVSSVDKERIASETALQEISIALTSLENANGGPSTSEQKLLALRQRVRDLQVLSNALQAQSMKALEFAQPFIAQAERASSIERWSKEAFQLGQDQLNEQRKAQEMDLEIQAGTQAADALKQEMEGEYPAALQASRELSLLQQRQEVLENALLVASHGPKTEAVQDMEQQYAEVTRYAQKYSLLVQNYQTKMEKWNALASRVDQATAAKNLARANDEIIGQKIRSIQDTIQKNQEDSRLVERGLDSVMRLEQSEQPRAERTN